MSKRTVEKITTFLTNGGMVAIFIIGIFAIVLNLVSFYCGNKFKWGDLLWEVPLYSFCGTALWTAWKMFRNVSKCRRNE